MIEEKRLKEAEGRMKRYVADRVVLTGQPVEDVDFFMKNADDSLQSARCLYDVSAKHDYPGYDGLSGWLWVINASYYSMFYMARALLEHAGIKLRAELSIHAITFDALVSFYYLTGKLQKQLFAYYAAAKEDAAELLGQQRAGEMIQDYFYERRKRASFTYETGEHAMHSKAKTSLQRATAFNREIRRIIRGR